MSDPLAEALNDLYRERTGYDNAFVFTVADWLRSPEGREVVARELGLTTDAEMRYESFDAGYEAGFAAAKEGIATAIEGTLGDWVQRQRDARIARSFTEETAGG